MQDARTSIRQVSRPEFCTFYSAHSCTHVMPYLVDDCRLARKSLTRQVDRDCAECLGASAARIRGDSGSSLLLDCLCGSCYSPYFVSLFAKSKELHKLLPNLMFKQPGCTPQCLAVTKAFCR